MMKTSFSVPREEDGARLDRVVAEQLPELSRTRVQELIAEGRVRVNGAAVKVSHRLHAGDVVQAEAAPRPPLRAEAEEIPLEVLYEDEQVVVVNKPAGMVVHAGAGKNAQRGTLVNALLGHYGKLSKGSEAGGLRPGIVHRLDKETSGCIVVARNDAAHAALALQFEQRIVRKIYLALVHGVPKLSGRIELAIARDRKNRTRMTTGAGTGRGRASRTDWRVLLALASPGGKRSESFALVEVGLHTGRTHQIRVHFSALKHPIAGDTLYGAPAQVRVGGELLAPLARNFLHAGRIRFIHPRTGAPVEVRAPLPTELKNFLAQVGESCGVSRGQIDAVAGAYL